MRTQETLDISDYLTDIDIENEIAMPEADVVLVDRDSICAKITSPDENGSYDKLIEMLNQRFRARFNYVSKTDEWLMLDKICDED